MRTSTEIQSIARNVGGEENAVRMVAEAGFDCYDFSMMRMAQIDWSTGQVRDDDHPLRGPGYLKFVRHIASVAKECGISCNQTHAPFPVANAEVRSYLKRAIECTAEAGGAICVIHPNNHLSGKENAEMYRELLPFAHECGVKIAVENMWNWDREREIAIPAAGSSPASFLEHLAAVNDDSFVVCLDIGHAEMAGLGTSAVEMFRTLGTRIACIHMHDNDLRHDSHQLPLSGLGSIDFDAVTRAMREVGYRGDMTLEADRYMDTHKEEDPKILVGNMARVARTLADMVEGK